MSLAVWDMNWPLCAPAAHCTFDRICMDEWIRQAGGRTGSLYVGIAGRQAGGRTGLELDKRFDDD